MEVLLAPDAQLELVETLEWMAERSFDHAMGFDAAYAQVEQRIAEHPEWFPEIEPGIRRALIQRYRYAVLFMVRDAHILVVAVMHQHRRPGYWRDRLRHS